MSFIKITDDLLEKVSLTLHPSQSFITSSTGATGSAMIVARGTNVFKDVVNVGVIGQNSFENPETNNGFDADDFNLISALTLASRTVATNKRDGNSSNVNGLMEKYMSGVNNAPVVPRNSKKINIFRFEPPFVINKNAFRKNTVRKILMPYYLPAYDNCYFGYTNYHTLNFFTASIYPTGSDRAIVNLPTSSCLIYPNHTKADEAYIYSPTEGPFSVDFYINPRYTTDNDTQEYRAGTILHMSSTFAVSIVSGSSKDTDGRPDRFRILLQLSHSADVLPSTITSTGSSNFPNDLIFLTKDNVSASLKLNHWHHVTVRWGGLDQDNATGSIFIDGAETQFHVPSRSFHTSGSDCVFVGNYFNAPSIDQARFFNSNAASNEGITDWNDGVFTQDPADTDQILNHPLNAEIHDVKIYKRFLYEKEIKQRRTSGPPDSNGLLFYVPPWFVKETRTREVAVTPFQKIVSTTDDPINTSIALGVGGKLINLENYTREMIKGEYPRLFQLTASQINYTVEDITAEGWIYSSGSSLKRNFTILPNDNGIFTPDYTLLHSGTVDTDMSRFIGPLKNLDISMISIEDLVPTASIFPGLIQATGSILDEIMGSSPENPGVSPGSVLTILQRTRDPSSNIVTFFDISSLYYGNRINPKSFHISDPALSGSGGKIRLSFKDNGKGGLYRSDAATKHPTWTNHGNIFYDEGIVLIKTPHALSYGKDGYHTHFQGEQNTHIMVLNVPCPAGLFNSSSNPQYELLSASFNPNDLNSKFVYVTNINFHDDNLNVIMRANLAQPFKKRVTDEVMFRIKKDF